MSKIENVRINPLGFREYDARWLYPKDINQEGIKNVGQGLGSQIISKTKKNPRVIVGHDYRSYSEEVKKKLIEGLVSTGCNVEDIGLALSPTVYFAQFNLNADAVAMVTASHNENGWTGIKMGIEKGLTHSPKEMNELKKIVLEKKFKKGHGTYKEIKGFENIYINSLLNNKIKNFSVEFCASEIPIEIQSIEMTKQFSTNIYFAIVGGIVLVFPYIFYLFA